MDTSHTQVRRKENFPSDNNFVLVSEFGCKRIFIHKRCQVHGLASACRISLFLIGDFFKPGISIRVKRYRKAKTCDLNRRNAASKNKPPTTQMIELLPKSPSVIIIEEKVCHFFIYPNAYACRLSMVPFYCGSIHFITFG